MKIGIISDVHGNLPALQAALQMLDSYHCDEIIHTGDVVNIGPHSRQCLQLLLSRKDVTLLLGNHDRDYLIGKWQHMPKSHVSAEHKKFVFDSIGPQYRSDVSQFPLQIFRKIGGVKFAFVHYALETDPHCFMFKQIESFPTAQKLDVIFEGLDADVVFFGHKHEPCDIMGKRMYIDVGSIGCHPQPLAKAVVLQADSDGKWSYERVEAPYDRQSVLQDMLQIGLPDAQYIFDFYFNHLYGVDGGKQ